VFPECALHGAAPCGLAATRAAGTRAAPHEAGGAWPGRAGCAARSGRADLHKDVQRGLRDDARVERARERRVVDHAAARHVHHARAALHLGERRVAEDALRAAARG